MPLTKLDSAVQSSKMLPKNELAALSNFDLTVQRLVRINVSKTLVGTLYPAMLADEIYYIEQLLESRHAR